MTLQRAQRIATVVAISLLCLLVAVATLGMVRQSLAWPLDLDVVHPSLFLMLLPFAAWSYGLRLLRWHSLVQRLVPGLSPVVSGYSQIVGFAFAATPGRIAELYKLKLLERATGVPAAQSLPAALVERLTDLAAFGLLVVVGELFHWSGSLASGGGLVISLGALGMVILLVLGYVGRHHLRLRLVGKAAWPGGPRWLRLIPGIHGLAVQLALVREGGAKVTTPSALGLALACVALGRVGDSVVLWQISHAVGYPVPFPTALIMIGSAGLVGGVTLSPGGFGATEATLVGLVVAQGAPLGAAVVTGLGARALIFWIWVVLGLVVFVISQGKPLAVAAGLIPRSHAAAKE